MSDSGDEPVIKQDSSVEIPSNSEIPKTEELFLISRLTENCTDNSHKSITSEESSKKRSKPEKKRKIKNENKKIEFVDTSSFDKSNMDPEEIRLIEAMFGDSADDCCTKKCNKKIPQFLAIQARDSFKQLSESEQDFAILAHLECCKEHEDLEEAYAEIYSQSFGNKRKMQKARCNITYRFRALPICKKMYFFIHDIQNKKRFDKLQAHFIEYGLTPREPKSIGPKSTKTKVSTTVTKCSAAQSIKNAVILGDNSVDCCSKKCNSKIPRSLITEARDSFTQLSKPEQDLVILAHLECCKETDALETAYAEIYSKAYGKRGEAPKTRCNFIYRFHGLPICKRMYRFIHNIQSNSRFGGLINHFNEKGLIYREHKLTGRRATRADVITAEMETYVANFIKNYAEKNAIVTNEFMPNFEGHQVMELPASTTKSAIYKMYISALEDIKYAMGLRSFHNVWTKFVPYVRITPPAVDPSKPKRIYKPRKRKSKAHSATTEETANKKAKKMTLMLL